MKNISMICERYPFISRFEIGKSVCGRPITALTVGHGRIKTVFAAAFHGCERMTATVLLNLVEDLCKAAEDNMPFFGINTADLLMNKSLFFIPVVNPDGCEISLKGPAAAGSFEKSVKRISCGQTERWNANARGVDINHNFNAGWEELHEVERANGIFGPSPRRYGGIRPESEPEAKALVELCRKNDFNAAFAFHSQGEVIYWKYGTNEIKNAAYIARTAAELSGYALDAPTGLAVGGGFKDWFCNEFSRPALTIEIGKGVNPLPPSSGEKTVERLRAMFAFLINV